MGLLSRIGIGQAKHSDFDHDAAALEETLPSEIAGRPLMKWSLAGAEFWKAVGRKPNASALAELAALGLGPGDMQMAVAGRTDTRNDPPYLVWVVKFGNLTGAQLRAPYPSYLAMAPMRVDTHRGEGLHERLIADRHVLVGNEQMVKQNAYHRGLPYVYVANSEIYAVIADKEAWAEEAIRSLPMRDQA
jgi:hypothetical protein